MLLALVPAPGMAADKPEQPAALVEHEASAESGTTLPPSVLCTRAEAMIEDGDPRHLAAARRMMEDAALIYASASCVRATLSRIYAAVSARRTVEDDELAPLAVEHAREAVRLDPASAPARAALAGALLANLEAEQAGLEAARAVELDGDSIPALQTACVVRAARGDTEGAREAIGRALALRPESPISHHLSGNVRLLSGDDPGAAAAFRNAIILAPEFTPARLQLASAYEEGGNLRAAAALYKSLLATHPEESGRAHLYMARSLMKRASWKAALGALEKASFRTRRGLSDGTVLYYKGLCLEQLGRDREAMQAWDEMVAGWPDATRGPLSPQRLIYAAWEGQTRIHLKSRDVEKAAAVMLAAVAHPEAPPELFISLSDLYAEYRLPGKGLQLLEQGAAAAVPPRAAEALASLHVAWARLAQQSSDTASMARMVASLEGRADLLEARRDYVVDLSVIRALAIAGRSDQALGWLRRAVAAGYTQLAWMRQDPELAPLSMTPEFDRIAAGLQPTP